MSRFLSFSKSYNYTKDYEEGLYYIIQKLKKIQEETGVNNTGLINSVDNILNELQFNKIDLDTVIIRLCALKKYDEFNNIMKGMNGFGLKVTYDKSCLHKSNKLNSHRRGGKSKKRRTNKKRRNTRRRKI